MAFGIPSLRDLVERARLAFRANLPGTDAWLWPNNIGPSAKVMAGLAHEVFGYADWIARQKFATTADGDSLDLHGAELGMARLAASAAQGSVVVTATGAVSVAAGAVLSRSDGVTYTVTAAGALPGAGTLTLPVAAEDPGLSTIAAGGTPLTAISGVTGSATFAVAAEGLSGGSDREGDDPFRERILFRKRNPPQGGSAADYVIWASEVPGVTRVFVERIWAGPGTVRVFPIFDDYYSGGIAPPERIAEVAAHLSVVQPAGANVLVAAPAAETINITIAGLVPDTTEVRSAVLAELEAMFRRLGRVSGTDTVNASMPYLATPLSFSRSWIWQSAANAAGEMAHSVTVPSSDVTIPVGSIPVLGTVTFA